MPNPKAVANDWHFWGSSASMFSGAYFKIKQIQLGYTIPEEITKKALINRLRLYVSLDDFFTFTKDKVQLIFDILDKNVSFNSKAFRFSL